MTSTETELDRVELTRRIRQAWAQHGVTLPAPGDVLATIALDEIAAQIAAPVAQFRAAVDLFEIAELDEAALEAAVDAIDRTNAILTTLGVDA